MQRLGIIIGLIALVALLIGGIAFFATQGEDERPRWADKTDTPTRTTTTRAPQPAVKRVEQPVREIRMTARPTGKDLRARMTSYGQGRAMLEIGDPEKPQSVHGMLYVEPKTESIGRRVADARVLKNLYLSRPGPVRQIRVQGQRGVQFAFMGITKPRTYRVQIMFDRSGRSFTASATGPAAQKQRVIRMARELAERSRVP